MPVCRKGTGDNGGGGKLRTCRPETHTLNVPIGGFLLLFLMPGRSALERRGQCAGWFRASEYERRRCLKKDGGKTTGYYKKNVRVTKCTKISKELMASI